MTEVTQKRTRNAKASEQIIYVLKSVGPLNAMQIATTIGMTPNSAKATLNRLAKLNKVSRTKHTLAEKAKAGPQAIYVYSAI